MTRLNTPAAVLAAALLALSATAARADDPTIDTTPFVSTHSRAEVKSELRLARRAQELAVAGELGAATGDEAGHGSLALARSTVKAEVRAARARGELAPAGEVDVASITRTPRVLTITTLARR
jgi:hypothetical protein